MVTRSAIRTDAGDPADSLTDTDLIRYYTKSTVYFAVSC